jgi:PAT family beta-lactamase induction signal transducer AmpG
MSPYDHGPPTADGRMESLPSVDNHRRSMTHGRYGRLALFGFLYFVQGALLAYVLIFNNLYLRRFGASAGQLSFLNGLLVVPFILKVGIGVMSDKVRVALPVLGSGHRVPYIRSGLLMISAGGITAVWIHPVNMYPLFLIVALFIAGGLALYDTVMDGLAIDVTPASEQGLVQGTMVVGRALGLVTMAAVFGRLIAAVGWHIVFITLILLTLTPQLLLRHVHEPATRSISQTFSWAALRVLWRPEIGRFCLYGIVYSVAIYGTNAIITLFANEELGRTLIQIGDVASLSGLGMIAGGLAAMGLARRLSIWRQGLWTATAVFIVLMLLASVTTMNNIAAIFMLWGFCLSASEFVYITLAMAKSDPRMGASHFAIFMAISNVGIGIGQATSTGLIDTIDFRWIFVGLALISLLSFPLLVAMRRHDKQQTI